MKKKTVVTKKVVRDMIKEAGQLQQMAAQSTKLYNRKRNELFGPLKTFYGIEHYVSSPDGAFQAVISYDERTSVDLFEIINLYNRKKIDGKTMKKILYVNIGKAKKILPSKLEKKLFEVVTNDAPTLHISKIGPNKD